MNNTATPRSAHNFARTANVNLPRSKFDLSHSYKTTLDGGYLVPILTSEMLPGDSWQADSVRSLARMTTPLVPFMDGARISYFFFAVPKRLLWDNFEDFITGSHKGKLGTTHTAYPVHTISATDWSAGSVYDYMGIPKPATGKSLSVNALPLRAYNLVYNEWFRDENLCPEVVTSLGDDDSTNTYALKKRGKRKDYFTGALPFLQKGPDVSLPLGSSAPVVWDSSQSSIDGKQAKFYQSTIVQTSSVVCTAYAEGSQIPSGNSGKLEADLSNATAATINSLREAFAVQSLFEASARFGSRYTEALLGHWGVTSPDFRLQRPEYIGGGSIDFIVNSVPQTSATVEGQNTPQGNLAAFAKATGEVKFQYSAVEHCIILGLACIYVPNYTYQQGLNRMWSRSTRLDEYWPEFARLGEQPVYEKEIYATGDATNDDAIFGYQERYAEYRYFPSLITGKLRSTDAQSLDVWHLAQEFQSAPSLSQDFIEENPPFARVLAVQNEPQFVLDTWFSIKAIRPLPMFGTPATLTHF